MKLLIKKWVSGFREEHGIGRTEPIRMKSLLLKLGVLTLYKPMPAAVSGMAVKVDAHRFVLVNCEHSLGRQHFTLCHELYHLYIQPDFTARTCQAGLFDKKKDPEEYRADLFATYLLLPEEGILELIPTAELKKDKPSLATLLKVEHYYACSRSALLYRLREMDLADNEYIGLHKMQVKSGARAHGYDTALYEKGNHNLVIGDYGAKARFLFDQEQISESHYLSLMRDIGIEDLDQENGYGEEDFI